MAFQKILIAVNDESFSLKPAQTGIALAESLQAAVAMVFVIDQRLTLGNIETGITPNDALVLLRKEAENTLEQLIEKVGKGREIRRFTPEGRPTAEILSVADEWGADLIVMGTHGKSGLLQLIAGSISEYIKHHSKVPVLIVPSK